MIEFSARHDKCLPASALVAIKDKTLLVVFPSLEVCNNVARNNFYSFSPFYLLFYLIFALFPSILISLALSYIFPQYELYIRQKLIYHRQEGKNARTRVKILDRSVLFLIIDARENGGKEEEKTLNLFQPISLWRKCIFPLRSSRLSRIDSKSQAAPITRRTTSHRDVARTRKGLRVMDGRKSFQKLLFFPRVYLSPTNFRST